MPDKHNLRKEGSWASWFESTVHLDRKAWLEGGEVAGPMTSVKQRKMDTHSQIMISLLFSPKSHGHLGQPFYLMYTIPWQTRVSSSVVNLSLIKLTIKVNHRINFGNCKGRCHQAGWTSYFPFRFLQRFGLEHGLQITWCPSHPDRIKVYYFSLKDHSRMQWDPPSGPVGTSDRF